MASSTPPRKKSRLGGKRVWIALGIVVLLVVAYVWYQNRSSSSSSSGLTGPLSTGSPTSSLPTDETGGASGGGTGTGTDNTTALLGTLQGENQSLLDQLLASEQGILSLAGSSLGSPNATTGSSTSPEVVNSPPVTTKSDASGVGGVAPSAVDTTLAPPSPNTPVVDYNPGPSAGYIPSTPDETDQQAIDAAAAAVAPTYDVNPAPAPPPTPTNQGNAPRSGGTSSNSKQGVISIH